MSDPRRDFVRDQQPPRTLEYRAGADDRQQSGPLPTIDGPIVRFSAFLFGVPIGLVLCGLATLLVIVSVHSRAFVYVLLSVIELILLVGAHEAGKFVEGRLTFFVQGILGGAIVAGAFAILGMIYS
jgi:hypothetical protein